MVAISFSVFKKKIKTGKKRQTIRPYSSKRFKQFVRNRNIQLYWKMRTKHCEKLGDAILAAIYNVRLTKDGIMAFVDGKWIALNSDLIAQYDGFENYQEMLKWFCDKYHVSVEELANMPFMLIRWNLRSG